MGASNSSKYGNFILQDDTKLLNLPKRPSEAIKVIDETLDLSESQQDTIYLSAVDKKSEYLDAILPYIRKCNEKIVLLFSPFYAPSLQVASSSQPFSYSSKTFIFIFNVF